ncbi:gliding motility lipoprotein GldB [Arenibacter latericius]|uniref:gliding motility lipoprotein GldB n=1 Tax=Arenibacter latericius TaxID=86104 RepID=UPI00047BD7AC|nr:gliding motility lipoprotein GldB [Arenibacter latericius]MDX1363958.1 gliding motility lipoprotein GldB [Arenibacter latericius]
MRSTIWMLSLLLIAFYGCKETDKTAEEVAKIDVELKVSRFDKEFADATPDDIPKLKKNYPYLFPKSYPDSVWVAKVQDTLQVELLKEVQSVFPKFDVQLKALESLFQHIKYYYPNTTLPKVVTVTSDVDYNNRVILTDTLLLIGLDNYLGPSHEFYSVIPKYVANGLDKKFLPADVASAFAKKVIPSPKDRSFLSKMVYYGKELYLKQALLPQSTEDLIIGYHPEELEWASLNEEQIWRYFIERELLYSTDNKLEPRFLDPAPFSKFQLELDNESPGRLGRYIGWQIVKAFMDTNEVSLQEMLKMPEEELFKMSKFKPRKVD